MEWKALVSLKVFAFYRTFLHLRKKIKVKSVLSDWQKRMLPHVVTEVMVKSEQNVTWKQFILTA